MNDKRNENESYLIPTKLLFSKRNNVNFFLNKIFLTPKGRKSRFCLVKAPKLILRTNKIFVSLQEEATVEDSNGGATATHFSQLDPKNMKVAELRVELDARNLPSKGKTKMNIVDEKYSAYIYCYLYVGLKNQLVARLIKALKAEADPTSSNGEPDETEDVEMADGEAPSSQEPEASQTVEESSQEKIKDDGEPEINIAEMDISEVTIIDEYDSTKCEEEKPEKPRDKKKEEPRKLDEKERLQIEKRYQLPENPHIVVHPSKTAKNGKFDCTVMSLSLLLDYRPEDTKEHSFEVSLFAELFNEMLTRDFGFNIFKAINFFPPIKVKEESKEDDKKKESKVDGEGGNAENSNESADKKEPETEAAKEDSKEGDKKDKKRHHPDDSDDSVTTKSDRSRSKRDKDVKDSKVERPKYITAFPDLLLSFVYFDHTHCGYIFEKDLEDLFYTLGLNLSRSQVRKIAEKFVTRDSLYYRKLTDRLAEVPYVNPMENVTEEQLSELAKGNKILPTSSTDVGQSSEIANVDASGGLVQFNGSLVNIQQLLEQMKRMEAVRENNERLLVDLRQKNGDLTSSNSRNDKRIKELNTDLKSMSRKLQDAESGLSSATVKY